MEEPSEYKYRQQRRRRKKKKTLYLEMLLFIIALGAVTCALYFVIKYHSLRTENQAMKSELSNYDDPQNPYYSQSEVDDMLASKYAEGLQDGLEQVQTSSEDQDLKEEIKQYLKETGSPYETLKLIYPDELIVLDDGGYQFFPISETLEKHSLLDENFSESDNGRISYADGDTKSVTGIDVSRFQETVNWKKVAADDIDYAYIRVGYRGYTKGEILEDDTFEDNIEGALKNNLDVGVYFLTQATSDTEAKEEAQFVLDEIEPYKVTYPIVIDVEAVGGSSGRGNALSVEDRTRYVKIFMDIIENAGYDTMIYGNLKTFLIMLNMDALEGYSKWFAGYTDTPYFPYAMDMWQYTDTGSVSGIKGNVDIDISFIK